jgi:regulation of enolase protein 1 (concanavalin A-like superfamily)
MSENRIPALPAPLTWLNQPEDWTWSPDGRLTITAGATTDWFIDPQSTLSVHNAPALLFPSPSPCLFSARVSADLAATFDAGVLTLYQNPQTWAKLCLERSPQGQPMIVSVVTRDVSDDCNAYIVEGNSAYLRVAWLEHAFAFHASPDGVAWNLIRYFRLAPGLEVQMGFLAQSPTGRGCTASFSEIRYESRLLTDIRSGE